MSEQSAIPHASPILTEDEAVAFLRLDQSGVKDPRLTLKRYRRRGLVRGVQLGKRICYLRSELTRFARDKMAKDPR